MKGIRSYILLYVFASLFFTQAALAIDYTWNGGSGEWTTASNWTPSGIPGADDKATINAGSVTVTGTISIAELILVNGILTGDGTLTITDTGEWNGSLRMEGTGSTIIAPGATLTIAGTADRQIRVRTFINEGILIHTDTARLFLNYACTFENAVGGLVDFQGNGTWLHNESTEPTLTNHGTFRKSAGTGETYFSSIKPTCSSGSSWEALTGTLRFPKGVDGTAIFHAADGAQILIQASSTLDNIALTGPGLKSFTGGTLTLSGTIPGENVRLDGAYLVGSHTLQGIWDWYNGIIHGDGTTTIDSGATLRLLGPNDHHLRRHLLVNGSFLHESSARLFLTYGALLETAVNGLIDIQGDFQWIYNESTPPTIENNGTILKSAGDGTASIQSITFNNTGLLDLQSGSLTFSSGTFNNTGEVRVQSGTITHTGGGTSTGKWNAAANTTVLFSGGSPILNEGTTLTGEGLYRIAGSTVAANGDIDLLRVELSTGVLTGSGTVTFTDTADWNGSLRMEGTGTTIIANGATLTLSGTDDRHLRSRTLTNQGTVLHLGSCRLLLNYGATFINEAGKLVELQGDGIWLHNESTEPTITNHGTFRKSAGTGETYFGSIKPTCTSGSSWEVQTGTLRFPVGVNGTATFYVAEGAQILIQASSTLDNIALTGSGLKSFTGGTLTLSGTTPGENVRLDGAYLVGSHTLQGTWDWYNGLIHGDGTTIIDTGATLRLLGHNDHHLRRHLLVNGSFLHESNARFFLTYGALLEIAVNGLIDIQGDVQWIYNESTIPTVQNNGTVRKSAGDGTASIQSITFNNAGLLDLQSGSLTFSSGTFNNTGEARVQSGTLTHSGNGTSTGKWNAAANTTVLFSGGSPILNEGTTLTGEGLYRIAGSTVVANGDIDILRVELSTGILTGSGTVTFTDIADWTGSLRMEGPGTTIIANGVTLTLSGPDDRQQRVRKLINQGTVLHLGSCRLLLNYGAAFTNEAGKLVEFQGDGIWLHNESTAPKITNLGTFRKSAGTGESYFSGIKPTCTSGSHWEVLSGTLRFPIGVDGTATFHAAEGTQLLIQASSALDNIVLTGSGLKSFTAGTLTLSGTCAGENVRLDGSYLVGSHTLQGTWDWYNGMIHGEGTTTIDTGATLRLLGTNDHQLRRHLLLNGSFLHEGSARLLLNYDTIVETTINGLIDLKGDVQWLHNEGTAPTVTNNGTIRKSAGTGEVAFTVPNPINKTTGRIECLSGTIRFPTGATEGGTFHAGAGAQLLIQGNSTLTDVAFTGPGILRMTAGSITLSGFCNSENMEIAGADILGTHTLRGTWHWSTGRLLGPGTTTLNWNGILRIIGDSDHVVSNRTLLNHGLIQHIGNGRLAMTNGSSLLNASDGIVDLQSDSEWADTTGAASSLINEGVIYKTGPGSSFFAFDSFQNSGVLASWNGWFIVDKYWVWHYEQGWIYFLALNSQSFYYYDIGLIQWVWTAPTHYPFVYLYAPFNTWAWYYRGTPPGLRWFYLYNQNEYLDEWVYTP